MNQNKFTITGRVIDHQTSQGIPGLRVEAWDKDLIFDDLVGSAETDQYGRFRMSFTTDYFSEIFFDRRPDLMFKVFSGEREIRPIEAPFLENMQPGEREITIEVDLSAVEEPKEFVVRGTVKNETGAPQRGLRVYAVDVDLRREEVLGEATTDSNGHYEITYTPQQFARAEKKTADLLVRVYDEQGEVLAHTDIRYNAGQTEEIDLVLGSGVIRKPSEYDQIVSELTPLLGDLSFADLEESEEHHDISFLSGETGIDAQRIDILATAYRFENRARDLIGSDTGDSFSLKAPVFYGLFREGMPMDWYALLSQSKEIIRRSLLKAVEENIIPAEIEDKIDDLILPQLQSIIPTVTVNEPVHVANSTLPELLDTVIVDTERQKVFVSKYIEHQGTIEEFWQELENDEAFAGKVKDITFVFRLNAITGNHLPLINELQDRKDAGEITVISDLARYTEEDWLEIIHTEHNGEIIGFPPSVTGLDDEEKAQNYARALTRLTEDAFPTAFVRYRLEEDDLEGKEDLIQFLENRPDFNIKRDAIELQLDDGYDQDFIDRLKSFQRTYRITSRYRLTSVLLKDGIDSARRIVRMGKNLFIKRYGEPLGMTTEAVRAYECAREANALSLHLATEYGFLRPVNPFVIPESPVTGIPDWPTLFGPLELCECRHCRSVRGPAAYFVDLLQYLGDRPARDGERSARDVLFSRRPDLGSVRLSCENTNTPLPYIDLVNEILEDAVAQPQEFQPFKMEIENDLNNHHCSERLQEAFNSHNFQLHSPKITVGGEAEGRIPSPPWWDIDDLPFTYHVIKQENNLKVASRSRQTKGSAAERAAVPQYMNPDAYQKLKTEIYPWTLPFDLNWETIKIHLAHLGTSRVEVMETFLPGSRREILENTGLVNEVLQLNSGEAEIITGAVETEGPWTLWGFPGETGGHIPDPADSTKWIDGDNWLNVLSSRVDVFLQQSGLHYRQMLDLFTTGAINPIDPDTGERRIRIVSTDPESQDTCDLTKLKIEGLNEQTALLIVRFVRLWRRLGWSIYDLDRTITAFGLHVREADTETYKSFLKHLSAIQRLREGFDLPIESLLVFWSNIGTRTYIDHESEGQPTIPSLYDRLFRNENVINPPDPAFTADPKELTGSLSAHQGTITAALGISAEEFSMLVHDSTVVPEDNLDLNNLSSLYRNVLLSRKLKLSIGDYLTLLNLFGTDPFGMSDSGIGDPLETLIFVEKIGVVKGSGFSITELDYLLCHSASSAEALSPDVQRIAQVLEEIRSSLQKIAAENSYTSETVDLEGDLSRQKLALLEWCPERIDRIIEMLNDGTTFETDLESLPTFQPDTFPPENLKERIYYDQGRKKLLFHGIMSKNEKETLQNLAADTEYQSAIDELYEQPRKYLLRNLRTFSVTDCNKEIEKESFAEFFARLKLPENLKDRIYFDATTRTLHFRGVMTEQEKTILTALSRQQDYLVAIADLFEYPLTRKVPEDDRFFYFDFEDGNIKDAYSYLDDELLFANGESTKPGDRFSELLKRLLRHLKKRLGKNHIIQTLSSSFDLEMQSCSFLLDKWLKLKESEEQEKPILDMFLDPAFSESNVQTPITRENFPDQFRACLLLQKVSLVISRLELGFVQLGWLFDYPSASWPDLNLLPLEEIDCTNCNLDEWVHLFRLCELRDTLPNGESVVDRFFRLVADSEKEELINLLNTTLGWPTEEIETLIGDDSSENGRLKIAFPKGYRDETVLWRLYSCFHLIERLGFSAELCCDLGVEPLNDEIANRVVQSVKAKYDDERWLEIAKSLQDQLRNMRRSALVDYLIAHPLPGKSWRNVNDLYSYFLIDPEMDACMMTSRIKQAISTVQLFVQRCLMNLEKEVAAGADVDDKWRQWKWMKNYRVWEANRRIFLYPENWIEPELRDDKSPFFKELESELMQSDLTLETAAEAFLHYLEKLDQVARLEIVGECHQVERDKSGNVAVDILHVFGRTKGTPHVYYYRQRVNSFNWTAWERIDLDIEGDHLIPVVWNRRLYLFWPIFTEKSRQVESSDKKITELSTSDINPPKYWEIKLAWSERKEGKWLNKKISSEFASIDVVEGITDQKELFFFKWHVDQKGALNIFAFKPIIDFLEVFSLERILNECNSISQTVSALRAGVNSLPVNNKKGIINKLDQITNNISNLASKSEEISQAKERDMILNGLEHMKRLCSDNLGLLNNLNISCSFAQDNCLSLKALVPLIIALNQTLKRHIIGLINILKEESKLTCFTFFGCHLEPVIEKTDVSSVLEWINGQAIPNTVFRREFIAEEIGDNKLYLPAPDSISALDKTPGTFLLLPHPDAAPLYRQPFFYMDDKHDFFIEPVLRYSLPEISLGNENRIDPGKMTGWIERYIPREIPEIDPGAPVESPVDPAVSEPTYPDYGERPTHGRMMRSSPYGRAAATSISASRSISAGREVGGWIVAPEYNLGMANNFIPVTRVEYHYKFSGFYHPYICDFISQLNKDGIEGLLQRPVQRKSALLFGFIDDDGLNEVTLKRKFREKGIPLSEFADFTNIDDEKVVILDRGVVYTAKKQGENVEVYKNLFEDIYEPNEAVVEKPIPYDDVDFEVDGSYALYNWELFFHAPLMIADRLSKNQRFEEAQKWFHYIFDPTDISGEPVPQKYWRTKPFFETTKEDYRKARIEYILRLLAKGAHPDELSAEERADLDRLRKSVSEWRNNPFKPHVIARLRSISYQKTVVMKYIDNLIAWGDRLFRRDTIESINEATQLYILAAEILGPRAKNVPPRALPGIHNFEDLLSEGFGPFSNALVEIENFIPPSEGSCGIVNTGEDRPLPDMPYFCVPKNSKLLSYWDTVADRLFKIRHCMNIEGVVRQLPLFEPPIEPGLLVRAAAAGVDIGSALNDITANLPHYRFRVMVQKATELCNELKALGASLLSALEKKDAEKLAMIRAEHETALLKRIEHIKKLQVEEAEENLDALRKSRETVLTRYLHYQKLLGVKSPKVPAEGETIPLTEPSPHVQIKEEGGVKMIPYESSALSAMKQAHEKEQMASEFDFIANFLHSIPSIKTAPWGIGAEFYFGFLLSSLSHSFRSQASESSFRARKSDELARFALRQHDWTLQNNLAARELMQIDKQILASEIRKAMAEKELDNHRKQIEQAEEIEEFLKEKYTNQELYNWMSGKISGIYFQAYQLAYDVSKRAEQAWRYELGISDSSFIQFGYWDNLKKGLLAGERLLQDIKRMEVAYLEHNKRELELTKHVSLRQLDPFALLQLRVTGSCEVTIPEWLFDLDTPGHYMRRIKNVALSIPAVTGPYTGVHCTLTLLRSSIRKSPVGGYPREAEEDDRFVDYYGTVQSIVTSSGQQDSGLFETNLRDERYLPFEGSGVISTWKLELPNDYRTFDYNTISDVILHIRYTARQGVDPVKVKEALSTLFSPDGEVNFPLIFDLKHDFPNEWQQFVSSEEGNLEITIKQEHFPYFTQEKEITVDSVLVLSISDGTLKRAKPSTPQFSLNSENRTYLLSLPPDDNVLVRNNKASVFLLLGYHL